jgi:pimeloyl-ACP methyl ester carboxylesterase
MAGQSHVLASFVSIRVHSWFHVLLCTLPAVFLTGCATQIFLHPETARKAFAARPVDPATYHDRPEIIEVTNTTGHRLTGWLFASETNRGIVLVGDGNATGMAHTYEYNRFLLHQGFNVLILSYQGFDTNDRPADIKSLVGDVETFYQYCRARFPRKPIALVAESISTAPFFVCASRHPEISAIVLEALVNPRTVAYSKANDLWWIYPIYPTTLLNTFLITSSVPKELDLRTALERHPQIPALFIHHPRDRITPYRTARKIYEQYEGQKEWLELDYDGNNARHMIASGRGDVTSRILGFLHSHL